MNQAHAEKRTLRNKVVVQQKKVIEASKLYDAQQKIANVESEFIAAFAEETARGYEGRLIEALLTDTRPRKRGFTRHKSNRLKP